MLATKRPIAKFVLKDYWADIGQLPDYELAKETYQIEQARHRRS
jgi:NDP-sugar pyrophosphorylase family protein